MSAVGCPSYPSPPSHGASQQASHFPGCPAGGTHPLNVGHRSPVDVCATPASPPKGSPPVPDAASLVTVSLVAVAFPSLGFGGCILGSLQSCAMVFNSEFIAYKKVLEMVIQKSAPQNQRRQFTECPEQPLCLHQREAKFCWSLTQEAFMPGWGWGAGGGLHWRVPSLCQSKGPREQGGDGGKQHAGSLNSPFHVSGWIGWGEGA